MIKKSIILFISFLFSLTLVHCQNWKTKNEKDPFDGHYSSAYVKGKGTNSPYNSPLFVINYFKNSENLNIYFSEVGYAGCNNKKISITFDGSDSIYTFNAETGKNNEIWFLKEDRSFNSFIEQIKKHNKMFVIANSECNENRLEFKLNGSSLAIRSTIPENYFEKENERFESLIEKAIKNKEKGWLEESEHYFNEAAKINKIKTDSIKISLAKIDSSSTHQSCFEKLLEAFEKRGALPIEDFKDEEVIVTIRRGSKTDCYAGITETEKGEIVKIWLLDTESNRELVYNKEESTVLIDIENGVSSEFDMSNGKIMNVFFINRLNEKN